MSKHNVNEVAKMFDVSTATIYKKAKKLKARLEGMTTKEKGVIYFSSEAVEVIRQEITTAPKETVLTPFAAPVDIAPMVSRLDGMEKVMMVLVEEIKSLRMENASLKGLLLPPARSAPAIASQVKKEPTFWEGFHQNVLEVQEWMRGVLAPFTEVFRGG